jgi:KaiC/GvpD/RAD55 family RecA-like ATPase
MRTHSVAPNILNKERGKGIQVNGIDPQFEYERFGIGAIEPAEVIKDAKQLIKESSNIGLFTVLKGNEWLEQANKRPVPNALWLCLWYEGEICILFADTNLGKSILAVQIAVSLAVNHKVLYFDFELSDKQFEARYSNNYESHYNFPENFYRAEINPNEADFREYGFETIEDYLNYSIERAIARTGATILIIDNLTYLRSETEKAKDALPLMKHLKALKRKYSLSILALAHTPKRDLSKPITRNDLQGSKMLINFCDSSFAIGESTKDKTLRYIKQIKERNTEKVYDAENIAVYQIVKPDNFLHFEFLEYGCEREHLKNVSDMDRAAQINEALALKTKGISNVEIARKFGVSEGAIRKWLKKAETQ